MTNIVNKKTEEYYDNAQILYNLFWSDKALHYGFWDKRTEKLSDAIENTDRFVSKLLNLQKNDYVLDAGCGVGGSSLFIAEKFGVKVMGITLSSKQIKQARKNARKQHLDNLVSFEVMDFNKARFKDKTFTKIFGIESICHAPRKIDFLKEAYRLLKSGSRLVVCDGFLLEEEFDEQYMEGYNIVLKGWGVQNLSSIECFRSDLEEVGFTNIEFHDKLTEIKKSIDRIYKIGILGKWLSLPLRKMRVFPENVYRHGMSCIEQKSLFENIFGYGVFVADK